MFSSKDLRVSELRPLLIDQHPDDDDDDEDTEDRRYDRIHVALTLLWSESTRTEVRKLAVFLLDKDDLEICLTQLVQALRFEDTNVIKDDFLRHLMKVFDPEYKIRPTTQKRLRKSRSLQTVRDEIDDPDLATFLIDTCSEDDRLSNQFYWNLLIECESQNSPDIQEMYIMVLKRFLMRLEHGSKSTLYHLLQENFELVQTLSDIFFQVHNGKGSRISKTEKIIEKLETTTLFTSKKRFLLPIDPRYIFDKLILEKTEVFKAENSPCKLCFSLVNDEYRFVLFKYGDDLRQDQFTIQMIKLFDRIWKGHGFDLKLTPYTVIATSINHGFVEFVESQSLTEILSTHGSISQYLNHLTANNKDYDIIDNFVKSTAAYCMITYVLGIGDRHLDNILITNKGNIFHVDFGYILGNDPKPLPLPPLKLSKHMINAMGGYRSKHFFLFRYYCHVSFLLLRRHSDFIQNLIYITCETSFPTLNIKQSWIRTRLVPHLSEEEAINHVNQLIRSSTTAVFATVVERVHSLAQFMRK